MSIAKIQSGDTVKVIAGNYKGTIGMVTKVVSSAARNGLIKKRVSVSNVAKIAKFRKSQMFQGQKYPGQQFEIDRTIAISNVALFTGEEVSKTKIEVQNNKKVRVYKKTSNVVIKERVAKPEKAKAPVELA
jgi:large subunit ribosomal protein L24